MKLWHSSHIFLLVLQVLDEHNFQEITVKIFFQSESVGTVLSLSVRIVFFLVIQFQIPGVSLPFTGKEVHVLLTCYIKHSSTSNCHTVGNCMLCFCFKTPPLVKWPLLHGISYGEDYSWC